MQTIDHSGLFKTLNVFINIANKFYLIFLSMMPEPLKIPYPMLNPEW